MKILLINPDLVNPPIAPVGLEYVTEHLKKKGHDVNLVDLAIEPQVEYLGNFDLIGIGIRNIDNTGFSPVVFYLPEVRELIETIRNNSQAPIVIGGAAVNLMPDEIREYVGADYAVVGKGFDSIDSLVESFDKSVQIKPVIEVTGDAVVGYFQRDVLSHEPYAKEGTSIGIATKFGCPFNCSYCDYPIGDGVGLRERSIDEVIYEAERLYNRGVYNMFFADANFNISAEHGTTILKELNRSKIKISWGAFLNPHPLAFTDDFFKGLLKSGKQRVSLGVDSLSARTLFNLNKPFTMQDIERATSMCQSAGVLVNYSILFGHPDEAQEDVLETFANIDRLKPDYADIVMGIRLFPKTPLYSECLRNGIIPPELSLLEPYYITPSQKVRETILEETARRPNCHFSNPLSLKMYRD